MRTPGGELELRGKFSFKFSIKNWQSLDHCSRLSRDFLCQLRTAQGGPVSAHSGYLGFGVGFGVRKGKSGNRPQETELGLASEWGKWENIIYILIK